MWELFTGEYEKTEYDIRLFNGVIFERCWPNAGTFHTQSGQTIPGGDVKEFRVSKKSLKW